jgi:hypothetical protein
MSAQEDLAELRANLKRPCEVCGAIGDGLPCLGCRKFVCVVKAECHRDHFKAGSKAPVQTPELGGKRPRGWSRS